MTHGLVELAGKRQHQTQLVMGLGIMSLKPQCFPQAGQGFIPPAHGAQVNSQVVVKLGIPRLKVTGLPGTFQGSFMLTCLGSEVGKQVPGLGTGRIGLEDLASRFFRFLWPPRSLMFQGNRQRLRPIRHENSLKTCVWCGHVIVNPSGLFCLRTP
jgi:hypothetical protein